jgi:hypothetical protein
LVEALYAVDTVEVLLMMNFPDKEPLEVLMSLENAKRPAASLTGMASHRDSDGGHPGSRLRPGVASGSIGGKT